MHSVEQAVTDAYGRFGLEALRSAYEAWPANLAATTVYEAKALEAIRRRLR
jgi:hypothetical protein